MQRTDQEEQQQKNEIIASLITACNQPNPDLNFIEAALEKLRYSYDEKNHLLYCACSQPLPNLELVKLLINHGAKASYENSSKYNNSGNNYYTIHAACLNGAGIHDTKNTPKSFKQTIDLELVKVLIENQAWTGHLLPNSHDDLLALILKEKNPNLALLKLLLSNYTSHEHLQLACQHPCLSADIIIALCQNGAKPIKKNYKDNGKTAIDYLNENQHISFEDKEKILAAFNLRNQLSAIKSDKCMALATIKDLLANIQLSNSFDYKNELAKRLGKQLWLACHERRDDRALIEFLINNGANPNVKSYDTTPLTIVCWYLNIGKLFSQKQIDLDLVKYLLDNGADINFRISINGETHNLLFHACFEKNPAYFELVKLFLKYDTDVQGKCIDDNILYRLCQAETVNIPLLEVLLESGMRFHQKINIPSTHFLETKRKQTSPLTELLENLSKQTPALQLQLTHLMIKYLDLQNLHQTHRSIIVMLYNENAQASILLLLLHGANMDKLVIPRDNTPIIQLIDTLKNLTSENREKMVAYLLDQLSLSGPQTAHKALARLDQEKLNTLIEISLIYVNKNNKAVSFTC